MEQPPKGRTRDGGDQDVSFTEQGSWSPGWWGQCGTSEVVTGTPRPDIQGSTQSLGGEFLRGPSGEPRFNAGLIKGTVGVPGRVGDPSHWTPHYGPPGKQSLQPKRVPQINQLLLHLQDCLICIIETKEAAKRLGHTREVIRVGENQGRVGTFRNSWPIGDTSSKGNTQNI